MKRRTLGGGRRHRRLAFIDRAVGLATGAGRKTVFDPDSIEQDAADKANAELPDDLHRPPLEILCDEYDRSAMLTPFGRVMARSQLVTNLANRAATVEHLAAAPRRDVEAPVFVVGLPRTGTTVLQQVLSLDPANRVLRAWETIRPVPAPSAPVDKSDERFRSSRRTFRIVNAVAPDAAAIHHVEPHLPTECIALLANSLSGMEPAGVHYVPEHLEWVLGTDQTDHYGFFRDQLEVLGGGYEFDRWVLKSPAHLASLDVVADVFPDARFVWTHRDPVDAVTSHCSLTEVLYLIGSAAVDRAALGGMWADAWTRATDGALEARDRIGEERFIDIWHRDIVDDPLRGMGKVYEAFGWPLPDAVRGAVVAHTSVHGRDRRGRHVYDAADYGLDPIEMAARFAPYRERFDL